jgi:hypothetical protein
MDIYGMEYKLNEKIKKLAIECGLPTDSDRTLTNKVERFAELIMRETFDWVVENVGLMEDAEWQSLKKHFGVE